MRLESLAWDRMPTDAYCATCDDGARNAKCKHVHAFLQGPECTDHISLVETICTLSKAFASCPCLRQHYADLLKIIEQGVLVTAPTWGDFDWVKSADAVLTSTSTGKRRRLGKTPFAVLLVAFLRSIAQADWIEFYVSTLFER